MFDTYKIRMIGLPCGEETITIMLSRFNTIPERDGQMDRQIDLPYQYRTLALNITVVTRDENRIDDVIS